MRTRRVVTVLTVLALVAGLGVYLSSRWDDLPLPAYGTDCAVDADGRVALDADQMANAATIAAVGVRLGMPDQAVVVALATAFQESKLRNLPHLGERNDHDSIGLFQQRPSQGWGNEEQLNDPRYASERFYLALAEVPGWEAMRITDAAQTVQRSAFPEAYQKWSDDATVLATALLGRVTGAVACTVPRPRPSGDAPVTALTAELTRDWGDRTSVTELDPARVEVTVDTDRNGWRYAHWLVAHSAGHGVTRVHFGDLEWTAARGTWLTTDEPSPQVHAELVAQP